MKPVSEEDTSPIEAKSQQDMTNSTDAAADSGKTGSGKGLASLALLAGLAGLAAGGWSYWQSHQLQQSQTDVHTQIQRLTDAQQQSERARSDSEGQLMSRLQALPSAQELQARQQVVVDLQNSQQRLSKQVQKVLGQSRQEWRLAEAEYLLRMAGLRLSAQQDVRSAIELIKASDEILRLQDDPAAYGVRQRLAAGLEALRTLPMPDRTGLFMQLGALRDQGAALQTLSPEFKQPPATEAPASGGWQENWHSWEYWWEKASRYVRLDFKADQDIRPLLAGEALAQVRLAYCLALEQAQWAVLNGNQAVYQQAMKQAGDVLDHYFNGERADVQAIKARLDELAAQRVELTMPDLTPTIDAMQNYITRRESSLDMPEPAQAQLQPAAEVQKPETETDASDSVEEAAPGDEETTQ